MAVAGWPATCAAMADGAHGARGGARPAAVGSGGEVQSAAAGLCGGWPLPLPRRLATSAAEVAAAVRPAAATGDSGTPASPLAWCVVCVATARLRRPRSAVMSAARCRGVFPSQVRGRNAREARIVAPAVVWSEMSGCLSLPSAVLPAARGGRGNTRALDGDTTRRTPPAPKRPPLIESQSVRRGRGPLSSTQRLGTPLPFNRRKRHPQGAEVHLRRAGRRARTSRFIGPPPLPSAPSPPPAAHGLGARRRDRISGGGASGGRGTGAP